MVDSDFGNVHCLVGSSDCGVGAGGGSWLLMAVERSDDQKDDEENDGDYDQNNGDDGGDYSHLLGAPQKFHLLRESQVVSSGLSSAFDVVLHLKYL